MDAMEFLLQDSHITFAKWWGEVLFAFVVGGFAGFLIGILRGWRQPETPEICIPTVWTNYKTTPKEESDGCNN